MNLVSRQAFVRALVIGAVALLFLVAGANLVSAKGTLEVDPSPVSQGSSFTLSGCGYPAPTALVFHVDGPGTDYFTGAEPIADSCFSEEWIAWWSEPGRYSITSYYRDSKGALRKVAVVKFAVE